MKLALREYPVGPTSPKIMGILNVTPDSFSDGNSNVPLEDRIEILLRDGADILDIGGESTRPGAPEVPEKEELLRVLPALRAVRKIAPSAVVSIDTRKSSVAEVCLSEGADIINDVSGFEFDPALADIVAKHHAGCVIMHSRSTPERMQRSENLFYGEGLIPGVLSELKTMLERAVSAGVAKESVILDPGIGFAKTAEQSMELIRRGREFSVLGCPLLSGPSRKSFIGKLTGEKVPLERDYGTCGAAVASILAGYAVLRVHNVRAVRDCLKVFSATCPDALKRKD